ncbi:50S ribosomal protein L23 [Compostibacter hankyongensis]|uniref:Large ribosomal subunit protein uL23 n=1 Tax=Compostibacter hankyongensis TaxID=1007089 RepID=A0ABP8GAR4_9BACT
MKSSDILIRPVVTEKANNQTDKLGSYTFVVARAANKLEIKKAVEAFYGVTVDTVNTHTIPGKNKFRYTKSGFVSGRRPPYKKATVKLAEGETIDLFANI